MSPGDHHERLADAVEAEILKWIVERNLEAGDRLPSEQAICEITGVSRGIVREALKRLQADGVVESRRGAGSYLRRPAARQLQNLRGPDVRRLLDVFEVRIELEPVAARMAAKHLSPQSLRAIIGMLEALSSPDAAPHGGELHLHRTIAMASGNPMFLVALDALGLGVEATGAQDLPGRGYAGGQADAITSEHLAVLQAIRKGDADTAETTMRLHLLKARNRAAKFSWGSYPAPRPR